MRFARALLIALLWSGPLAAAEPLLWAPDGDYPGYPAAAQHKDPWRLTVDAGALHDSNLFRLASGADPETPRSTMIYNYGLRGDADLRAGRQHFLFNARADDYHFQRLNFLDYLGYDAGAQWQWKLGRLWDGDLSYSHRRFLTSFATLHQPLKDLIDADHAHASAAQALFYNLRLTGAVEGDRYRHSAAQRQILDFQTLAGSVWLQYISPTGDSIGLKAKATQFRFPNKAVIESRLFDNRYRIEQLSATLDWHPGGASQVQGHAGYSRLRNHEISQRDFSGITYLLQYRWTPLGSTVFKFGGYRDLRSYTDISASYILVQGYSTGMSWAPTYKTVLQLDLIYENWHFRGDPGIVPNVDPQRHDTIRTARLTAGYTPLPPLRLDVAYEYGRRSSNAPFSAYVYNEIAGELQLSF